MKFENTQVMNFKNSLRGMRNPKESWGRSDSFFGLVDLEYTERDWGITDAWMLKKYPIPEGEIPYDVMPEKWEEMNEWVRKNGVLQTDNDDCPSIAEVAFIGPDDMRLAQQLIKAGPEHRKFMRQIFVSVDITAPLYW